MEGKVRTVSKRLMLTVLSAALVLGSLVFPGLGHTAFATEDEARVEGFSLTVGEGTLGLNVFLGGISDSMAENGSVIIDGATYELNGKQEDGTYKISHPVSPNEISKKLPITLYSVTNKVDLKNEGAEDGIVCYSVKDYLLQLEEREDEMGRLAKAIDDYGTCAEYYFSGAGSIPVDIADADFSEYAPELSGKIADGTTYYGTSLVLSDTIAIRHYYAVTRYYDSCEIFIDGEPSEILYDEEKGLCYIEIPGIKAWDIVHPYEVKATVDGAEATLKYSVMSYAYLVAGSDSEDPLFKLVKSIYWYYAAFQECLDPGEGGGGNDPVDDPVDDPVEDPVEITTDYVTYKMFGAKGDGKTDDYDAIVKTHAEANAKGLPVKADQGAVYYIGHMDKNNTKGALIMTETDWTGAEFIIDDSKMTLAEKNCYLFTVEPSKPYVKQWMNPNLFWTQKADGTWTWKYEKDLPASHPDYQKINLGLSPALSDYPVYNSYSAALAYAMDNHKIDKGQTQLSVGSYGAFPEKALYVLKSQVQRWGRNGSANAVAGTREQEEVIIVNRDGSIDSATPVQWNWDNDIYLIQKYPIDEKTLTVRGGVFTTIVNTLDSHEYVRRGINIVRSNIVIDGVEHYLAGEEKQFTGTSYYSLDSGKSGYHARLGAPYQGFFVLDHCAYVTLKNCVLTNHLRVYNYNSDVNSTAPYDYYAEYAAAITLDNCVCSKSVDFYDEYAAAVIRGDKNLPAVRYDETGIMDAARWGTTGTNFCKSITVQNGSRINRIDAHMGTYNLTVKDSTVGYMGIAAVGFGDMNIENVTSYAEHFITLRRDFGSYWEGNINIKNCRWYIGERYTPYVIFSNYNPNPAYPYAYDTIVEDGVEYYCTMPTKVNIDGMTIDASDVTSSAFFRYGVQVFSCPFINVDILNIEIDEDFLNNRTVYQKPLRAPKEVNVRNIKIIKSAQFADTPFLYTAVSVRNGSVENVHDEYFFHNTKFTYDGSC